MALTAEQREAKRRRALARKQRRDASDSGPVRQVRERSSSKVNEREAEQVKAGHYYRLYVDTCNLVKTLAHFESGSEAHKLARKLKIELAEHEPRKGKSP
jgi:hypothetical protein